MKETLLGILAIFFVVTGSYWLFVAPAKYDCRETLSCARPEQIHIGRIWEDGSYRFEYKDGTSETGCYKGGLCND